VQNNYKTLKRWTIKTNVFDFDYIMLPINEEIHWFLCAIVNPRNGIVDTDAPPPSQNGEAASTYPPVYVVVFDSLIEEEERHEAVLDIVGEYLRLEYEERRTTFNLPGNAFRKESLQLIVPTGTPQQKNYVECGVFLLHFAELFMTQPPTKYIPEIDFNEWYPDFEIKSKRRRIKYVLQKLTEFKDIDLTDFVFLPGDPLKKEMVDGSIEMKALSIPERTRRHSTSTLLEYDKDPLFRRHSYFIERTLSDNDVTKVDYDQNFIERERKLWRQRQAAAKAVKAREQ
ncbi:Ulp1 protease, partial [Aphelenchoides avenae]